MGVVAHHEAEEGGDDGGVYLVLLRVADRGEPIDLIEEDDRRLVEVRLRPRATTGQASEGNSRASRPGK